MRMHLHESVLPLKHQFTIARSSRSEIQTLIVELTDGHHSGFGEATCNEYYGSSFKNMSSALDSVRHMVERQDTWEPLKLWKKSSSRLNQNPFALCALDVAAHDLWGKQQGKSLRQLWKLDRNAVPLSSYTIGIDSLAMMVSKLHETPDWPAYKIKLGTSYDVEVVRELRKHTDAIFRVDVNCGWTPEETISNSIELKMLGVEFIEQPLSAEDMEGSKFVFENSAIPIIADESCVGEADVQRCARRFHGINIKLMKCGGITPALRMIRHARELGLKVMVGCMTESTVGISAIAQLLPMLDYVDMDGATLLDKDIATGARVDRGKCIYANRPGTGVHLCRPT